MLHRRARHPAFPSPDRTGPSRPCRRTVLRGLGGTAAAAALLAGGAGRAATGRRVLHVDSYHPGNEWNDRIVAALRKALSGHAVDLKVVHLDSKRLTAPADRHASVEAARRAIAEFRPDVVTVSDDPAAQDLVMPYLRDTAMPVVFCGLNWDASVYGLPYRNTTGMVEVSSIPQILRLLRQHARGPRLGFLAEDTDTKRKELVHHQRLFGLSYDKIYLVRSHAQWREAFLKAQREVDMLLILGVGSLVDWDLADARKLAEEESTIPSGTDFEWLMPTSLVGVVKSPEEQGRWVAEATLRILDGVPASDIPLTYNRDGDLFFNARIARRLGIGGAPALARVVP